MKYKGLVCKLIFKNLEKLNCKNNNIVLICFIQSSGIPNIIIDHLLCSQARMQRGHVLLKQADLDLAKEDYRRVVSLWR